MALKKLIPLLCLLFFSLGNAPSPNQTQTTAWHFPLGDDDYRLIIHQHTKDETMVENTTYGVRNLDLILGYNNITCYDLGVSDCITPAWICIRWAKTRL